MSDYTKRAEKQEEKLTKSDNERKIRMSELGRVMSHPIDVVVRPTEDQEEVESEVDEDEEKLTCGEEAG